MNGNCVSNTASDFLGLDEDLKQKDLNESTSMAFLIPRMQGDGLLTCALIHHLVCLHNSIIEKSRNFVKMTLQRYCQSSNVIFLFQGFGAQMIFRL